MQKTPPVLLRNIYNKKCLLLAGDLSKEKHCKEVIKKTIREYGRIDILINNAALPL